MTASHCPSHAIAQMDTVQHTGLAPHVASQERGQQCEAHAHSRAQRLPGLVDGQ